VESSASHTINQMELFSLEITFGIRKQRNELLERENSIPADVKWKPLAVSWPNRQDTDCRAAGGPCSRLGHPFRGANRICFPLLPSLLKEIVFRVGSSILWQLNYRRIRNIPSTPNFSH